MRVVCCLFILKRYGSLACWCPDLEVFKWSPVWGRTICCRSTLRLVIPVFSWYACVYSEASTCKISLCCSEWLTKSSLTDSNVEQKMRSVKNSSLKTREQYWLLMAVIACYLCFQKPLLAAIRVIGGSCKEAIKVLNFFLNEANVNTIRSKQGRHFIP